MGRLRGEVYHGIFQYRGPSSSQNPAQFKKVFQFANKRIIEKMYLLFFFMEEGFYVQDQNTN